MERELIDILVDEREAINQIKELNVKLKQAKEREERQLKAFVSGTIEEDVVRNTARSIDILKEMREDYLDILTGIHKEMLRAVVRATGTVSIGLPANLKPEKITVEFAKNITEKSRDVEHKITRKGRVLRGSTNKVQN